jgi:hypothetical protein
MTRPTSPNITFNRKDFEPASQFGIVGVTPSQFLALLT